MRTQMDYYAGIRCLVLGAGGFIGRWVARALTMQGAHLHLVVRDRRSAERIFADVGVRGSVLELDLEDERAMQAAIATAQPEVTFNLAGYGVDRRERDSQCLSAMNGDLIGRLCEAIRSKAGTGRVGVDFVHAGSIAEYGATGGDYNENSGCAPCTEYGRSKLDGTQKLIDCSKANGLRCVAARLATVYGPGEHDGRLLPDLLRAATSGGFIELSAGNQERDFTYVEDVADGLLRLGLVQTESAQVVNLVTGRLTSVRQFAETAAGVLGIPAENLHFGAIAVRAQEEQHHLPITNERLKSLTGWAPPTGIADGIRKTANFLHVLRTKA